MNEHKGQKMKGKNEKTFLIYTPEYVKDKNDLKLYAIYPDYWGENIKYKGKHNWGQVPLLGLVREQGEYWAGYAAYTAGIVPVNATFGLRAVEVKTKVSELINSSTRRKPYRK